MPDWFDLLFSIGVGIMIFFVFMGMSSLAENIIQGRAADAQQEITNAYNLINYIRTDVVVGDDASLRRFERTTLGELLVHIYHDPQLVTYRAWSAQTTALFNRVFGEDNWYLSIRFGENREFFNEDGESVELSRAYIPEQRSLSGARVTSATIPTMNPDDSIELLLHIRDE